MRLYYEVGRKAFQRSLAYKLATLTGIIVNSFFGYIHSYIFVAVYSTVLVSTVAGFSLAQAISYAWLTQALITITQIWFDQEISKTIVSGDAVSDFSKPFDYQTFWLSKFARQQFLCLYFSGHPNLSGRFSSFWGAVASPQHRAAFPGKSAAIRRS